MVGMITAVLVCWAGSAQAVYIGQAAEEDAAAQPRYKEGELIVKFKKSAADSLEMQLGEGRTPDQLKVSASLDELGRKYKVKKIGPVIKNFKGKRKRIENLKKKDRNSLTKKERHLLRRLKRAPKGMKVPDLGRIYKIELAPGQSAPLAMAEYWQDPDVEYAQLNYMVSLDVTEPNDPNYQPEQWALNNDACDYPIPGGGSESGTAGCDVNAPEA
jgi:hypothetical protein